MNNYLFGSAKVTKTLDPDKWKSSGYGIGCHSCSEFLFTDESMGRNVINFEADMGSSVHVDNKSRDIILDEVPTQKLNDTA